LKWRSRPITLTIYNYRATVIQSLEENGYAVIPNVLDTNDCDLYIKEYKDWAKQVVMYICVRRINTARYCLCFTIHFFDTILELILDLIILHARLNWYGERTGTLIKMVRIYLFYGLKSPFTSEDITKILLKWRSRPITLTIYNYRATVIQSLEENGYAVIPNVHSPCSGGYESATASILDNNLSVCQICAKTSLTLSRTHQLALQWPVLYP
jgi:hypothetical protein